MKQVMSVGELKQRDTQLKIVSLLYRHSTMAVAQLSKETNLSLPTIRGVLEGLVSDGVVIQIGEPNTKNGRTPFYYKLNPSAFSLFIVELGQSSARCAIIDCTNSIVAFQNVDKITIDDVDLEHQFYSLYQQMVVEAGVDEKSVRVVGISMPGLIDSEQGLNHTIKIHEYQNVGERFSALFGKRVFLENDARMKAFCEQSFGVAKERQNVLVVDWSDSLGMGIIANNRMIRGANGFAGEFAHIRMVQDGELCICGKRGCMHTIASAEYLLKSARQAIEKQESSMLTTEFFGRTEELTIADVIRVAGRGDELSITLIRRVSENLASGLSILVQLHNPELIVVTGDMAEAGDMVKMPLVMKLHQYCLSDITRNFQVELSSGNNSIELGS